MTLACWAGLLLVVAGPGEASPLRVVTAELYNASGEFLPRIDEASEQALRDLIEGTAQAREAARQAAPTEPHRPMVELLADVLYGVDGALAAPTQGQ
jgi:hypothetical protein